MDWDFRRPVVAAQRLPERGPFGGRGRDYDQPKFPRTGQVGELIQPAARVDIRHALASDVIGWSAEINPEKFENVFVFVVAVKCRRE